MHCTPSAIYDVGFPDKFAVVTALPVFFFSNAFSLRMSGIMALLAPFPKQIFSFDHSIPLP